MGTGTSGMGKRAATGIGILQQEVSKSRTQDLLQAYNQLQRKDIAKMTNEEKMVRAVLTDELAERGNLLYDYAEMEYKKNPEAPDNIVYLNEKSYRVNDVRRRGLGEKEKMVADADVYVKGKWVEVKNTQRLIQLASAFRKKKNKEKKR